MTNKARSSKNPPPLMLKVRDAGEAAAMASALQSARPDSSGSARSAIDRWCAQLQRVAPAPADAVQNVFALDGRPHVPAGEVELVAQIFDHWRARMNQPRAKLDAKRRSKIVQRLRDGYTPAEIMSAIDGCAGDPWSRGDNDRGVAFNDIELICRDSMRLERFIGFCSSPPRPRSAAGNRTGGNTEEARAAWVKVINHVRGGRYRNGAGVDDGGRIDATVARIGGYRQIGQSQANDLRFIERRFIDHFIDHSAGADQVSGHESRTPGGHQT